ncbi:hypothetical protein DNTS_008126, partial [Danionella cerebrum]
MTMALHLWLDNAVHPHSSHVSLHPLQAMIGSVGAADLITFNEHIIMNGSTVNRGEACETCATRAPVVTMGSGLLIYPFGLNSSLVKSFCGDSDIYYAGECQIGWGYMLAVVGVMLTLFLPFFAKYAPKEQLSPTP